MNFSLTCKASENVAAPPHNTGESLKHNIIKFFFHPDLFVNSVNQSLESSHSIKSFILSSIIFFTSSIPLRLQLLIFIIGKACSYRDQNGIFVV